MTPTPTIGPETKPSQGRLHDRFRQVRAASLAIAAPLSAEDCQAQSMPDASPVKWHLAHTSWFWETFLLEGADGRPPFDPAFRMLFNSYYNGVGAQFRRTDRGLLTRPSLDRVLAWRAAVDARMEALLAAGPDAETLALVELGLAHEEQHQELMLTDLKHLLAQNPLLPAYAGRWPLATITPMPRHWVQHLGGLVEIGHSGDGFAFDNEGQRHRVWLEPFELATHPVTNGDWIAFMADGGYRRPELWLSAGWEAACAEGWQAPLYWRETDGGWRCFTLHGDAPVDPHAPVAHISFYEAEAFARWADARLPTEVEWEAAAQGLPVQGNFAGNGALHPLAATRPAEPGKPAQMFGDVWEWTRSDYAPYPGYRPAEGAVGEYNGKFMVGQQVLRGGSCATPPGHVRASYRNFFPPATRWQFAGLRLARDVARAASGPLVRRISAPAVDEAGRVTAGLLAQPPAIASGNFYDTLGSRLFEAITETPEYGLTRAEAGIFEAHAAAMAEAVRARLGGDFQLVDLGAGNCAKAEGLLPLLAPSRYLAIDIAGDFLETALARVRQGWSGDVCGLAMDFAARLALPADLKDRPALFFYPGSSIGNFAPDEAQAFLARLKAEMPQSALLLGADLMRDPARLEAAYDDAAGVTAAFNRNILTVLNRRHGTDFEAARWRHVAVFNQVLARIEMWLEAETGMTVRWPGGTRLFEAGERILTEISTKWTVSRLTALLEQAGFGDVRTWTSADDSFAVALGG
jgi:dimethylhistidine N-methyltransferase